MMFVQQFLFDQMVDRVSFDQTFRPTILVNEKMLECFAALLTKLYPEAGHVRPASQSRITILLSSLGFSRGSAKSVSHAHFAFKSKHPFQIALINSY